MIPSNNGRRFRLTAGAAVLLFALTGCAGSDSGTEPNAEPAPAFSAPAAPTPGPSASSSSAPATDTGAEPAADAPPEVALAMEASAPVSFTIDALDRQDEIIETGLREDNTLEVPPEHEGAPASWYNGSPTPGEIGPSVLLGHVNSTEDESGVFYDLESLVEGDQITVTREDGTTAVFEVYLSELYPKNDFPTKAVYQPTDGAEIRLITCDGFTESSGDFIDNLVIYGKLVDTQ